ncbi:hypothetical protein MN608_05537 [Microdochium nivale]|nr:hypothetical protein MN608_05537 [Microdochium nivale]
MATLRINRSATSASWPPNTTMIHDLVSRDATRQPEPQSARVVGIFFTIITAGICTSLLTHRVSKTRSWRRLSYIRWLVISQYGGAFIYTLIAAVLQYGYDPNINNRSCSGAAIICVVVYGLIKMVSRGFLPQHTTILAMI